MRHELLLLHVNHPTECVTNRRLMHVSLQNEKKKLSSIDIFDVALFLMTKYPFDIFKHRLETWKDHDHGMRMN